MYREVLVKALALSLLGGLILFVAACGRDTGSSSSLSSARVTGMSRTIIPMSGGQTISLPQREMTDTYALWSPLSESEQHMGSTPQDLPRLRHDVKLANWLQEADQEVMRKYLYRLTHAQRPLAARVLARAEQYLPMVLTEVKRRGLPPEIACLPLVESAFSPDAVSPVGAAGLWQLMPDTARRFGLTVNDVVDERFDARKATMAATAYLDFLYGKFGQWPLALAAYNCGEGALARALSRSGTESFSALAQASRQAANGYLARETLEFVPQFVAAVEIMSNGHTYGLAREALLDVGSPLKVDPPKEKPALRLQGSYTLEAEAQDNPVPRSKRLE